MVEKAVQVRCLNFRGLRYVMKVSMLKINIEAQID